MKVKMDVSVDKFVQDINRVKEESGRSSEEMLKYTMILMLQAGRSATPKGRTTRPIETEAGRETNSDDGSMEEAQDASFYSIYRQGQSEPRKIYLPRVPRATKSNTEKRQEAMNARKAIVAKFRKITFAGIAKESWGWAMKMLNLTSAQVAEQNSELASLTRRNPIETTKMFSGSSPYIEVVNKLGYILKLTPDIEQRMINSADARLLNTLDRKWQDGLDRAERRAS
ncbi:MAG: hypothetical protein WC736_15340 [Gallionella sp.]|jgi:hypothetical protein